MVRDEEGEEMRSERVEAEEEGDEHGHGQNGADDKLEIGAGGVVKGRFHKHGASEDETQSHVNGLFEILSHLASDNGH